MNDPEVETPTDGVLQDDEPNPNREAASYRRKLRDVEAERDTLAERVAGLQRTAVESLLHVEQLTPAAFFAITEIGELLDDNGIPDPAKVKAAAKSARQQLGLDRGLFVPAEGHIPASPGKRGFSSAFQPPTNR